MSDALLARLIAANGAATKTPQMIPAIVRVDGKLCACIDTFGGKVKIKEFATGAERWIERVAIGAAE